MRGAKTLADARHGRQNFPGDGRRIGHRFEFAQTHVAGRAVCFQEALAEVADEHAVAARDARRVAVHVPHEQAPGLGPFSVALEQRAPLRKIGARIEEQALGRESVAPGAAGFLLIVLERLRRARVDHEPDVGPVDPHAEGDRRHHDVHVLVDERVLVPMAHVVRKTRVIRRRAYARVRQPLGKAVHFAPRLAIDDAGVARVTREDVLQLALEVRPRHDAIQQIRPVERSDQFDRCAESQLVHDVAAHAFGRRRGKGVHARVRPVLAERGELPVFRPERVPPLTDAVGLVNRHETHAAAVRGARAIRPPPPPRFVPAPRTAGGTVPARSPAATSSRASDDMLLCRLAAATPLPTSVST